MRPPAQLSRLWIRGKSLDEGTKMANFFAKAVQQYVLLIFDMLRRMLCRILIARERSSLSGGRVRGPKSLSSYLTDTDPGARWEIKLTTIQSRVRIQQMYRIDPPSE